MLGTAGTRYSVISGSHCGGGDDHDMACVGQSLQSELNPVASLIYDTQGHKLIIYVVSGTVIRDDLGVFEISWVGARVLAMDRDEWRRCVARCADLHGKD